MNDPIKALVIHLPRATQRMAQVERLVAGCPVACSVLEAVDGSALPPSVINAVYKPRSLHEPRFPLTIGKGEIGCFLSHREAWRRIAGGEAAAGLVFEDDVEIDEAVFGKALMLALRNIATNGVVQFNVRKSMVKGVVLAESGGTLLVRPEIVPLRMSCTLYSREAAARLLSVTEQFDRPVDSLLQMTWLTGIFPVVVLPSGVSEHSRALGGSTIQKRHKSVLERLHHELVRPLYRWAIARRSRQMFAKAAHKERAGNS